MKGGKFKAYTVTKAVSKVNTELLPSLGIGTRRHLLKLIRD